MKETAETLCIVRHGDIEAREYTSRADEIDLLSVEDLDGNVGSFVSFDEDEDDEDDGIEVEARAKYSRRK